MQTVPVNPTPAPLPPAQPGSARYQRYLGPLLGALGVIALCAAVGAFMSAVILPGVTVEGVAIGGLTVKAAERRLRPRLAALVDRPIILRAGGDAERLLPRQTGLFVDWPGTLAKAYAPGHQGSLVDRAAAWWDAARGEQVRLKPAFRWEEQSWGHLVGGLRARYAIRPVNAGWRVEADDRVTVTPGAAGRDLDGEILRQRLIRAALAPAGGRTVALPLVVVYPRLSTLEAHALGITEVIARYRTYFSHRDVNRSANLRLASTAVDQVLLRPGELFSFNRHVGPRIPDSGYREAPVVVNGKLVPGIGGGVCQVSSTLYNAALLADLQIETRHRHSITSAYVPPGRDATVAYNYFDFRFRNSLPRPVAIDMELGQGWLEARVLGRREPGVHVEVQSEIIETYPPSLEEVPDPSLPAGQRVVKSKGAPGYRVKVWQLVYRDGALSERRLVSEDRYQALHGVVRVGTGSRPTTPSQ
ncbi:MAG: VanW family protein [Chitinophagales bacterium]